METTERTANFERYLYRRYGDRSTPKHYLSDLHIFLEQLGDKPLRQVTAQDIERFIDEERSQSLAASTINRRLATLHTFFEYLSAEAPDESWPNPVNWRRQVGMELGGEAGMRKTRRQAMPVSAATLLRFVR